MMPTFADAFFFVALLNPKDRAHRSALAFIEPDLDCPLVTTTWVLVEVGDAMAGSRRNREAFVRLHQTLLENPAIEIVSGEDYLKGGIDLYSRRLDKGWSLTDCVSFAVMTDRGLTEALTGDHHFEQAGFRVLLREP